MATATILWRRLDVPGHDACRLEGDNSGWRIDGTAVFSREGVPALLSYHVECDPAWSSWYGLVRGWLGTQPVQFTIVRATDGAWALNGRVVPGLEHCADLDLGFTPATNLLQLRRLALAEGQAAEAPAAWLEVSADALQLLPQRYERRGGETYWYEAPSTGYSALLEVYPSGFIRRYPGLWESEP